MADLLLSAFRPKPKLVVKETLVDKPAFPVIDAHNHLGTFGGGWDKRTPEELFARLDEAHVRLYVDLDGGWGEDELDHRLRHFKTHAPERYMVFGGIDWDKWAGEGNAFPAKSAARLRAQAARGAQGLKIWKPFGLTVKDHNQNLVAIDDKRLDPIWATAGELHLPVMIHIADPVAFFDPVTPENERWDELHAHPDWQFTSPPFPSFNTLIEAFANLVRRHPNTTFIGAHVGCYAENLGWVSALLDECPNFCVDISARISELGRQPYSSSAFFLRHSNRILFGTDSGPDLETYRTYWRFLETSDEYFSYGPDGTPGQGRWNIYGLDLPPDILKKVYHDNAARILVGENQPEEKT
jgi:hypothetical protein